MCSHSELRQEIVQLKSLISLLQNELKEVPKLRESVASLTREVTKLRNASKDASPPARTTAAQAAAAKSTYSKAVTVGGPANKAANAKLHAHASYAKAGSSSSQSTPSSSDSGPRVKFQDVRRVWGTMRTTSTTAVTSTLKKLTKQGDKVSVKRKNRTNGNGREKSWWFLIKGEEQVLCELEKEWDATVGLQTNWKLESCYRPTTPVNADLTPSQPPQSSQAQSETNASTPNAIGSAPELNAVGDSQESFLGATQNPALET